MPYARDAVIEAIRQIITNLHPAMLALTGPDERHVDHRTANWFAIKACQALLKAKELDPQTVVLADQVYGSGGFKPAPYKYENYVVHLSGEAAALKQEMSGSINPRMETWPKAIRKPSRNFPAKKSTSALWIGRNTKDGMKRR